MGKAESTNQYESGIAQQFPAGNTFYQRKMKKDVIQKLDRREKGIRRLVER